jgi:hypothetical protein
MKKVFLKSVDKNEKRKGVCLFFGLSVFFVFFPFSSIECLFF